MESHQISMCVLTELVKNRPIKKKLTTIVIYLWSYIRSNQKTTAMKRSFLTLASVLLYFSFCAVSCEEPEPFVNIKTIESQIYNELKAHREANGLNGPFVHQFVMVKEAQIYSAKMSFGTIDVGTSGIDEHWTVIHDKIGGTNDLTLVSSTLNANAADIVAAWTSDSATNALILGDLSQCGVGVEYGTNQMAYITALMMLYE